MDLARVKAGEVAAGALHKSFRPNRTAINKTDQQPPTPPRPSQPTTTTLTASSAPLSRPSGPSDERDKSAARPQHKERRSQAIRGLHTGNKKCNAALSLSEGHPGHAKTLPSMHGELQSIDRWHVKMHHHQPSLPQPSGVPHVQGYGAPSPSPFVDCTLGSWAHWGGGESWWEGQGGGWACRRTVAAFCLTTRLGGVADAKPGCWQQEKLHFIADAGITCG